MKNFGTFSLIILFSTKAVALDYMYEKIKDAALKQTGIEKNLENYGDNLYKNLVDKEYRPYLEYVMITNEILVKQQINVTWRF